MMINLFPLDTRFQIPRISYLNLFKHSIFLQLFDLIFAII